MPAGEGMVNVQLLVINCSNRNIPCTVGEIGEIYVRSDGLAEGYLDTEATAEKFGLIGPESCHWKGIHDQMYHSGDLGWYLFDECIECTGHTDDQVKIHSFRIELGEIDTLMSQHLLMCKNVTPVRRDKDKEKILVSYFVPLQTSNRSTPTLTM
ncbi:hypothetical protein BDR03DRAFT_1008970 [Suillus americanus]|nr:hypothetical protein BDR03DRAFT_1008970 [Suillus americanus]